MAAVGRKRARKPRLRGVCHGWARWKMGAQRYLDVLLTVIAKCDEVDRMCLPPTGSNCEIHIAL